jgi:hypothetical protein
MTYNPDATPPNYSSRDGEDIAKGSAVRIQIIGIRSDVGAIFAVGKMPADWFG